MAEKTVKMKASFAGVVSMPAGSIQTMDAAQAERFVDQGYAEYVEVKPKKASRRRRAVQSEDKETR